MLNRPCTMLSARSSSPQTSWSIFLPSSAHHRPLIVCLFSPQKDARTAKEAKMQSTNMSQIKAALWDQAFTGKARVWCPMGGVVAIRRRKGQLLAMIRG